ncbi:MAG: hypothetical protein PHD72_01390 [Patescibacteria group bacterium]|nr:hypothetical protein [Patescibacteria group bacterium]
MEGKKRSRKRKPVALISVYDKTGVLEFAQGLAGLGWTILSTGGTAKHLREGGVPVIEVSKFTGHPECFEGRVKTLHPKIFAGILAKGSDEHKKTLLELGYKYIDLVAVNLYPFEQTIAKEGVTEAEAIEQIDIGGPSMVRAAAKNFARTVVVVDPADYGQLLSMYTVGMTGLPPMTRRLLALKVFQKTADYDAAIAAYMLSLVEKKAGIV